MAGPFSPTIATLAKIGPHLAGLCEPQLFRVCRSEFPQPWVFSISDESRFNITNGNGLGTSYWGSEPHQAMIEVFATSNGLAVPEPLPGWLMTQFTCWTLNLSGLPRMLADFRDPGWFGITGEAISYCKECDIPQEWANELSDLSWHGIIYAGKRLFRSVDPSKSAPHSVAVFGSGVTPTDSAFIGLLARSQLTATSIDQFARRFGMDVDYGLPARAELNQESDDPPRRVPAPSSEDFNLEE